jgi:hypothetical protein
VIWDEMVYIEPFMEDLFQPKWLREKKAREMAIEREKLLRPQVALIYFIGGPWDGIKKPWTKPPQGREMLVEVYERIDWLTPGGPMDAEVTRSSRAEYHILPIKSLTPWADGLDIFVAVYQGMK